jgi:hypothetical protein
MKSHQFKTNQLGVTYSEFGQNLLNQLNQAYAKLHGQNSSASTPKARGKYRTNQTTNS